MTHPGGAASPALVEDLRQVCRSVRFVSAESFWWEGAQRRSYAGSESAGFLPPGYPWLVLDVAQLVYQRHYTRFNHLGRLGRFRVDEPLAQANFARRLALVGQAIAPAPVGIQDEHWQHFTGPGGFDPASFPTVRVYWHVCRQGAVPLVRVVLSELTDTGVPFRFKIVSDGQQYARADAGVLYLPSSAWPQASPAIARVWRVMRGYLRAPVPMFARPLAPGLALAEDPGDGKSFGLHRSMLVAQGLWRAHEQGIEEAERMAHVVLDRLAEEGIPLAAPHLQSTRSEDYAWDADGGNPQLLTAGDVIA